MVTLLLLQRGLCDDPYDKVIKETRNKPITHLPNPGRFSPKENIKED